MRKFIFFLFLGTLILFGTTNIKANVYASAITVTYTGIFPANISYNLNQPASWVMITIAEVGGPGVATIAGGVDVGFNDVDWDGTLDGGGTATTGVWAISIEAGDDVGSDGFELTSFDTGPDSWYWSSSGVASNKRNNSVYFGMAYVIERSGGTSGNAGALETIKGLYLHDSFGKYLGSQQSIAYAEGNSIYDWDALAQVGAPFGATIGPDDRVYLWVLAFSADNPKNGGVAVGDGLWSNSSVETILDFSDLSNHNTISDAIVVGLGADRMLYTVEQNVSGSTGSDNDPPPRDADDFDTPIEIKRYALGESTGLFTGAGEVVIPTSTLGYSFRIEMDASGFLYVVQSAYDSIAAEFNIYGLSKWDISSLTATEMWHVNLDAAPPNFGTFAPATSFAGLALDEPRGRVYVARRNTDGRPLHNVIGYAMDTGELLAGLSFSTSQSIVGTDTTNLSGGGGNNIRDIAVDAAGNVLSVNSSSETFRVHSPPDGPNSFTTNSPMKIDVDNGVVSVNQITSTVPSEYSLEQNYPNPFNPSTIINFSISTSEFVTMKIYNSLGQEVSTVVNEFLNAGSYEVNFNAENLVSGMYVYKITAGSFTSTKKMLLLK